MSLTTHCFNRTLKPVKITHLLFIVIYGLLSLYILTIFIPTLGIDWVGHNVRPVAHRILIPTLTHTLDSLIPALFKQSVIPYLISARDSEIGTHIIKMRHAKPAMEPLLSKEHIFYTAEVLLMVYLTLLAFIWMFYTLAKALLPSSPVYAYTAPILAMLIISVINNYYFYTYDYAELFFSAACFYLLFKQRWQLYLLCIAIGSFNKETTIFAIIFYFIYFFSRLPIKQYLWLGLMQLCEYSMILETIHAYNSDKPQAFQGQSYIWTWKENFYYLYQYNNYIVLLTLVIIFVLLTYNWWEKPAFLKAGLWMAPFNIGAYLLTCHAGEYRDLFWIMPVLTLLATHSLVRLSGLDRSATLIKNDRIGGNIDNIQPIA